MKKSVIAQPPGNRREAIKIRVAEVFMSLLEDYRMISLLLKDRKDPEKLKLWVQHPL